MNTSTKGSALFSDCEGFLSELSIADESVLAGGGYRRRGGSGSGSSSGSSSSGSSGGGRGHGPVFVPFFPKCCYYKHYC